MGFPFYTIPLLIHLQDLIFTNLVRLITCHNNHTRTNNDDRNTTSLDEFHPSPSLVLLPIHLIIKSHKNHLPIVQYMMLKPELRAHDENKEEEEEEEEADSCCAVCLSGIELCHIVRKLGNCEHAFHVECLDSWMNIGSDTCPVCRAKLLPGHGEDLGPGQDPWRSERMVYLFGEDCAMEKLE